MNPHHHPKNAETKWLLSLAREQRHLWKRQRSLPLVELVEPFQSGWTRFFVLSQRSQQRRDARALETILGEINSEQHCWRLSFQFVRKHRFKKLSPRFENQRLRRIRVWRWKQLRWPDEWLRYFRRTFHPLPWNCRLEFERPELFEFKIVPRWITHVQQVDPAIEQRLDEIEKQLRPHGGWDRISYLKGGRGRRCWLPPKGVQELRSDSSYRQQICELRDDGVIAKALYLLGFKALAIASQPLCGPQALK